MSSAASAEPPPSPQRLTAQTLLTAFNTMNLPLIASLRTPTCIRHILPSTLGYAPQSNAQYMSSLAALVRIFSNFSLTCHEIVEDVGARKIVMYLRARADTRAGEYVNEYVWFLAFDEEGKIERVDEFVDTVMAREFYPRLKKAMAEEGERGGGGEARASNQSTVW